MLDSSGVSSLVPCITATFCPGLTNFISFAFYIIASITLSVF
jgi:hypothetical protein